MRASRQTLHIQVDTRRCESCGRCVEACRQDVLRVISVFFHSHVKVRHADRCRGCLLCVRACEHGAIQALRPQLRRDEATSEAGPVVDPDARRPPSGRPTP